MCKKTSSAECHFQTIFNVILKTLFCRRSMLWNVLNWNDIMAEWRSSYNMYNLHPWHEHLSLGKCPDYTTLTPPYIKLGHREEEREDLQTHCHAANTTLTDSSSLRGHSTAHSHCSSYFAKTGHQPKLFHLSILHHHVNAQPPLEHKSKVLFPMYTFRCENVSFDKPLCDK